MSCDISLYFERKINDKWQEIPIEGYLIPSDRNYEVFGFLAGVRGSNDGFFSDRGLPLDCSDNTFGIDTDFFSHTYAYLDEILNAPWKQYNLQDAYFYVFCRHILPRICSEDSIGLTDLQCREIRVVMSFRN